MVDAESLKDRGEKLGGTNFSFDDFVAIFVALAVHAPPLDAATGKTDAPSTGEMVAAEAGVNLWSPAEFGERED